MPNTECGQMLHASIETQTRTLTIVIKCKHDLLAWFRSQAKHNLDLQCTKDFNRTKLYSLLVFVGLLLNQQLDEAISLKNLKIGQNNGSDLCMLRLKPSKQILC